MGNDEGGRKKRSKSLSVIFKKTDESRGKRITLEEKLEGKYKRVVQG